MEHSKSHKGLTFGVAAAGIATTAVLAAAVWPALTRPEPPLEARGDEGLRIRLVEPPRAVMATASEASRLDVGVPEAARSLAQGREALFVATPPVRTGTRPAPAPPRMIEVEEEDDLSPPPPEPADDRWTREAWRRDRFEEAQRRRWEEDQRWAREDRAEMQRDAQDRRRWEDPRERDDDRYGPPPEPMGDPPPPSGW